MTTVSQVNPIWAYFNISESDYLSEAPTFFRLISGQRVASPVLEFIQANGIPYPQKGRIVLVNREITSQTGTIQLVAELPNADAVLRPGGFGRVRFQTRMNEGALLVPQAAVIEVQSIYQVAVVDEANKASFRMVQVGSRVGPDWIITQGLKPGDKVIVQGFMKVRDGTPVNAKPYVAPAERD
jgi:membrane fusion protein, multidrug efflux system